MRALAELRSENLLHRRQREWDGNAQDPQYVMYRRSDGSPEPEEAQRAVAEQLIELLEPTPEATLLDVGCGAGGFTRYMLPHFRQVTGTDLSATMLERARQVLPDVPLHQTPAHQLPFEDASFSRALCYGVFLLFPDFDYVEQAFREILRVVEPGGIVLLGDMPDVTRRHLSYDWRLRRQASPVKAALRGAREWLSDRLLRPLPRGFFHMSYFEGLAASGGHECSVVAQPPQVERSAWRVNLVIRKAQ